MNLVELDADGDENPHTCKTSDVHSASVPS